MHLRGGYNGKALSCTTSRKNDSLVLAWRAVPRLRAPCAGHSRCPSLIRHFSNQIISDENDRTKSSDHLEGLRQRSLVLYRHLLREAGRLPDPAARGYITAHIRLRFRDPIPKTLHSLPGTKGLRDGRTTRISRRIEDARQAWRTLRRANFGYTESFFKVLCYTYGLRGRRKHELSGPLLRPIDDLEYNKDGNIWQVEGAAMGRKEHAQDFTRSSCRRLQISAPPCPISEAIGKHPNNPLKPELAKQIPRASPALTTIMESQIKNSRSGVSGKSLKYMPRLKPQDMSFELPERNMWMRLMPQKRLKNQTLIQWRRILSRSSRPVPNDEWVRLGRLAGVLPWDTEFHQIVQPAENRVSNNSETEPYDELLAQSRWHKWNSFGGIPEDPYARRVRAIYAARAEHSWIAAWREWCFGFSTVEAPTTISDDALQASLPTIRPSPMFLTPAPPEEKPYAEEPKQTADPVLANIQTNASGALSKMPYQLRIKEDLSPAEEELVRMQDWNEQCRREQQDSSKYHPHLITRRWMRQIYEKIWVNCARMTWHASSETKEEDAGDGRERLVETVFGRWVVEWGRPKGLEENQRLYQGIEENDEEPVQYVKIPVERVRSRPFK